MRQKKERTLMHSGFF